MFISNIDIKFIKQEKEKKKKNYIAGAASLGAAGYIGQQTVRSGIPRALGVRLESHSTSNKNAKEILKNGGYIDPKKSGSGAIRSLESLQGLDNVTDVNKAKGKVYITGVRPDSISRTLPNGLGGSVKIDPKNENPLVQVLERKAQRMGYRAQSLIDWDKVNKNKPELDKIKANREAWLKETNHPPKDIFGRDYYPDSKTANRNSELIQDTVQETQKQRTKALQEAAIKPWKGRSLYVGGSDDYFMKNFKPDFDDPRSMYTDKKLKVFGNRFGAVRDAIKREGLGNLMKANKGRVAAGAAILGVGGLATAKLAQNAYNNITGNVKGYQRKSKNGKIVNVKSYKKEN